MPRRHPIFPADTWPALEIDASHEQDAYVVRLQGELDMAGAPALELALDVAEMSPADRIVLDLEEVTFIDAQALGAILLAGRRSAGNGDRLRVTRGKGTVAYMLGLSGIDERVRFSERRLAADTLIPVTAAPAETS
jgi:anti-anti-sigma factor